MFFFISRLKSIELFFTLNVAEAVLTIGHRSPISGFITLSFFLQGSTLAISKHGCTAFDPLSSDRKCSHLLLFPALYDTLLRGKKILESSETTTGAAIPLLGQSWWGKAKRKPTAFLLSVSGYMGLRQFSPGKIKAKGNLCTWHEKTWHI